SAAVDEKCSNADPNAKEYWRHTLATTYSTLCPPGWRLPTVEEILTTFNDWPSYLNKIFAATGETSRNVVTGYKCQDWYISFIAVDCLGRGHWGGRLQQLPDTPANNQKHCGNDNTHYYSGYVRCVR
ncbi:MAG: hypothetical protein LBU42_10565, partial [Prevotellaceae bacterium]|nr:hypothetical protein [Prevotellaceae bacterium]